MTDHKGGVFTGHKLRDIASAIGAEVVGDASLQVCRVVPPEPSPGPEDLVVAFSPAAREALLGLGARLALVVQDKSPLPGLAGYLVVERPRLALAKLLTLFELPPAVEPGVHPTAVVEEGTELGDGVSVGPFVRIGQGARIGRGTRLLSHVSIGRDARLGEDCLVHAGARVGDRVSLGNRVILQPNAVVGADGFSFVTPEASSVEQARPLDGSVRVRNEPVARMPSLGTVVVEDDVEIGAGTTIDRANLGATRIGARTKIDNLVQIAHNCRIGEDCLLAAEVGLAGSVVLGDRVVLGGQVGIADHKRIGDDAVIAAGSGVGGDVPPGTIYLGYPAQPKDVKMEELFNLRRLTRMLRDLLDLQRRVTSLERAASPVQEKRDEA